MKRPEDQVRAVLGMQWGDEGKGKIIDYFAERYEVVARPAGGPNTGHTVQVEGEVHHFHGLPEGAIHAGTLNVIGPGALIDPEKLAAEIDHYSVPQHLLAISHNTHLITPTHRSNDEIREATAGKHQGSTKAGMAYAAAEKYKREGLPLGLVELRAAEVLEQIIRELHELQQQRRILDLTPHQPELEARQWLNQALRITRYATDTTLLLNARLQAGESILISGSQGHWLDIDEQPYPYGSSTHTGVGGVISGLQIPPQALTDIVGVMKGFKSRVGPGPFVTEIADQALADGLRGRRGEVDSEYGTTSQRERRIGYLDLPEVRRSLLANGVTELALTKVDQLSRFGRSMLIASQYDLGGETVGVAPNLVSQLSIAEPVWEEIPLWKADLDPSVRAAADFKDLPQPVRKLVRLLEARLEVDIKLIGTGAERSQLIARH